MSVYSPWTADPLARYSAGGGDGGFSPGALGLCPGLDSPPALPPPVEGVAHYHSSFFSLAAHPRALRAEADWSAFQPLPSGLIASHPSSPSISAPPRGLSGLPSLALAHDISLSSISSSSASSLSPTLDLAFYSLSLDSGRL